jgi:PAS domain S-box-containing protein
LARHKFGFLALADLGLGLTGAILAVILITVPAWAPALLLPALLVYLVKRSHERLAASEARLEAIVGSAMDAIITVDDERRIVVFNRAAEEMFGYTRGRVLNEPVVLMLVDDARDAAVRADHLPSIARARRASGELFPVEMTRADLQVQGQRLSTLVVRDITARRLAEDERVLLLDSERAARVDAEQAIQLRDEFLLMAAHELRTPMTSLRGYAQLMRRRLEVGDVEPRTLRRAVEAIDQQSAKLARLISLLLDVAAIQAGTMQLSMQESDLGALVLQAVAAARSGAPHHEFVVDCPEALILSIDPRRLQQVLNNLLDNAIRFSPWGGTIEVSLARPDPAWASLEVRDYGLGVSPVHRPHLFDRFYRAHSDSHVSGLGLGLSVSRHIVERHGGTIEVLDPGGGGTRFVVRLPLAMPTIQPADGVKHRVA